MRIILSLLLLALLFNVNTTAKAAVSSLEIPGHTPFVVGHQVDLGPTDAGQTLHLRLWLKLHQPEALTKLAADVRDPESAQFQRWLSKEELDAQFKPSQEEASKVKNYLESSGLQNVKVDSSRLFVTADASVTQAQQLFQVSIHQFLSGSEVVHANTTNPKIDAAIAEHVAYVGGLSKHVMHSMLMKQVDPDTNTPMDPVPFVATLKASTYETACFKTGVETHNFVTTGATVPTASYTGNRYGSPITAAAPALPPCGYGPSELQSAYGIDKLVAKGLDGAGETIVIVDAFGSPTVQGDLESFSQSFGLPAPQLTIYQPGGAPVTGAWTTGQQGWAGETTLDVEYAHTMAPGAKIALVEALSDSDDDLDAAIAFAVENNLGHQISNSWSGAESQEDAAGKALAELVLQTAVARGISVHFSSGDSGDDFASGGYADVGFPASSPLVTSVGGTALALNADHSVQFHAGWGNNAYRLTDVAATLQDAADGKNPPLDPPKSLGFVGGAGGGPSRLYPKPAFQRHLPGTARLQPDVAFLADPFTGVEIVQSSFDSSGNPQPGNLSAEIIGGTSLACPMFTAVWSIANQAHKSSLGAAAPLLYRLPAKAFIDVVPVTSDNNVTGSYTDAKGANPLSALQLGAPQTETAFYSAFYNSPKSPYRWMVLTFGTDSGLSTAVGWDNVTGLGVPNGENFIEALK